MDVVGLLSFSSCLLLFLLSFPFSAYSSTFPPYSSFHSPSLLTLLPFLLSFPFSAYSSAFPPYSSFHRFLCLLFCFPPLHSPSLLTLLHFPHIPASLPISCYLADSPHPHPLHIFAPPPPSVHAPTTIFTSILPPSLPLPFPFLCSFCLFSSNPLLLLSPPSLYQHLAKHVMQVHLNALQTEDAVEGELGLATLKKFIAFARA